MKKGSEFPEGDERRYFKYRVVFQGNQVKDQNWEVAMFSETASTPATLEASRIADIYSCFTGSRTIDGKPVKHTMQSRDVEQAYLQAELKGSDTYIMLPYELWIDEMKKMKQPVFKLEKALYGHKNSGYYWQEFCDVQVRKAGFEPISKSNWPGVYFNRKSKLLLVVYVDDMKMAGPECEMAKAWKDIGERINLEVPKGDTEDKITFLGCESTRLDKSINGHPSRVSNTTLRASLERH